MLKPESTMHWLSNQLYCKAVSNQQNCKTSMQNLISNTYCKPDLISRRLCGGVVSLVYYRIIRGDQFSRIANFSAGL